MAFEAWNDNIQSHFKFNVLIHSAWKMLDSSFCLPETTTCLCETGFLQKKIT